MSVCWSRIALLLLALCIMPGCVTSQAELFRKQNEGLAIGRQVALTVPGLNDADRKKIVERQPLLHLRYIDADWKTGSYEWFLDGNRSVAVGFWGIAPAKPANCTASMGPVSADDSNWKQAVKQENRVPEIRQLAMAAPGLTEPERLGLHDQAPRIEIHDLPYMVQTICFIWPLGTNREVTVVDTGYYSGDRSYTVAVHDFSKAH